MNEPKIDWVALHKKELTDFVREFYMVSYNWRNQAYHSKWDKWERNYRNIYDPAIKAQKQPWQVTMFMPATMTNIEVISSSLTKLAAKKRALALEPRESGDELQAELNNDLMDYYIEKGDFIANRYSVQKEACIYGSGFLKIFWEKKYAKRRIRKPQYEGILEAIKNLRMPGNIKGYKENIEDVLIKNGIRYQRVHIRDIFLEPNSLDGQRLIHRDKVTYGELKRLADDGFADKDAVNELWTIKESDSFDDDVRTIRLELSQQDPKLPRPSYDKKHSVWEYWGPLPRKWIDFGMPEITESEKRAANEITPGKALVASGSHLLGSEENPTQAMEPPFLQMDYIWSGLTYGIGVAQIMEGLQEELNEIRNIRIDNVYLLMNKIFVVVEKYIVNMAEVQSKPGAIVRLKGSDIDDFRKVMGELAISDVPLSTFRETNELERQIQEATAANRVTLGTSDMARDTNQTLGGMELLRNAALDRFSVYAYIIGRKFDIKVAKKTIELIYQNIDDESVRKILGEVPLEMLPDQFMARWMTWKRQTPEDLDVCYNFVPVDVFGMENKFQKSQSLANYGQLVMSILPVADPKPFLKRLGRLNDLETNEIDELLAGVSGPIPTPMSMGQGIPSISKPTRAQTGEMPPVPSGSNGASLYG